MKAKVTVIRPLLPDEQAALSACMQVAARPWGVVTVGTVAHPRVQIVDAHLGLILTLPAADLGFALLIVSAVNAWAPPPVPVPVAPDSDLPLLMVQILDGAPPPSYAPQEAP